MKVERYGRLYAIVRCLRGCELEFKGERLSEHDGPDIDGLRRLARSHTVKTGHVTEYDLTSQIRYAPEGVEPK